MSLTALLILFGIIGQAASDEGTKVHEVAEVCLGVGIVMAVLWVLIVLWAWAVS